MIVSPSLTARFMQRGVQFISCGHLRTMTGAPRHCCMFSCLQHTSTAVEQGSRACQGGLTAKRLPTHPQDLVEMIKAH